MGLGTRGQGLGVGSRGLGAGGWDWGLGIGVQAQLTHYGRAVSNRGILCGDGEISRRER